jgi:hypothetical protein
LSRVLMKIAAALRTQAHPQTSSHLWGGAGAF